MENSPTEMKLYWTLDMGICANKLKFIEDAFNDSN